MKIQTILPKIIILLSIFILNYAVEPQPDRYYQLHSASRGLCLTYDLDINIGKGKKIYYKICDKTNPKQFWRWKDDDKNKQGALIAIEPSDIWYGLKYVERELELRHAAWGFTSFEYDEDSKNMYSPGAKRLLSESLWFSEDETKSDNAEKYQWDLVEEPVEGHMTWNIPTDFKVQTIPTNVGEIICNNLEGGDTNKTLKFSVTHSVTDSKFSSLGGSFTFSATGRYNVQYPGVRMDGSLSFSIGGGKLKETTTTEARETTAEFEFQCNVGEVILGKSIIQTAHASIPFTMDIRRKIKKGTREQITGEWKGTLTSAIAVNYEVLCVYNKATDSYSPEFCDRTYLPLKPLNSITANIGVGNGDRCDGDCDTPEDCKGDLICYQRDGFEKVPGCSGTGVHDWDYCIDPPIVARRRTLLSDVEEYNQSCIGENCNVLFGISAIMKSKSGCLSLDGTNQVSVNECNDLLGNQQWIYYPQIHQIIAESKGYCMDLKAQCNIEIEKCDSEVGIGKCETEKSGQQWIYNPKNEYLVSGYNYQCVAVNDLNVPYLSECSDKTKWEMIIQSLVARE